MRLRPSVRSGPQMRTGPVAPAGPFARVVPLYRSVRLGPPGANKITVGTNRAVGTSRIRNTKARAACIYITHLDPASTKRLKHGMYWYIVYCLRTLTQTLYFGRTQTPTAYRENSRENSREEDKLRVTVVVRSSGISTIQTTLQPRTRRPGESSRDNSRHVSRENSRNEGVMNSSSCVDVEYQPISY